MNKIIAIILCITLSLFLIKCHSGEPKKNSNSIKIIEKKENTTFNLLADIIPKFDDGDVNAIIEIPAGTMDKWELDKLSGELRWELVDNKPRIIDYIGYPGNYGMIPRTLLPKENGGDGDPLDIIVLGPPVKRGSILKCKIIGVLFLSDRGEQDDKLIAVSINSPLYLINDIADLNKNYNGISEIIKLWFTNYKGPNKMTSEGFGTKDIAEDLLSRAIKEYKFNNTKDNAK